jgi:WLM domain
VTVPASATGAELHREAARALRRLAHERVDGMDANGNSDGPTTGSLTSSTMTSVTELKLLYRGRRIANDEGSNAFGDVAAVSAVATSIPGKNAAASAATASAQQQQQNKKQGDMKPLKVMVVATANSSIEELRTKRSDPTIRGLDVEIARDSNNSSNNRTTNQQRQQQHWAEGMVQNKEFKFCRFEACTWQSFGHRAAKDSSPHAFRAMELLEKLATDPGIVAVMVERELVVGTLGEMDPIDDRLMKKKQQQQQHGGGGGGGCLLGYNTNGGARIDLKLRTDDLRDFRPYRDLVATLLHELSHNWVGEHNALFWTNYAQMRAEYLYTHAQLRSTVTRGKTTAELAGLDGTVLDDVFDCIMHELTPEMGQHGLHPSTIEGPIRQRIQELEVTHRRGRRLGGGEDGNHVEVNNGNPQGASSARELALAAAERRAREQQEKDNNQE